VKNGKRLASVLDGNSPTILSRRRMCGATQLIESQRARTANVECRDRSFPNPVSCWTASELSKIDTRRPAISVGLQKARSFVFVFDLTSRPASSGVRLRLRSRGQPWASVPGFCLRSAICSDCDGPIRERRPQRIAQIAVTAGVRP
jgi:hypothetical protein